MHRRTALVFLVGWCLAALTCPATAATNEEIELLHNLPSTVLVSSSVRNGKDRPEHLVDGRLDTAWNSKPNVADRSHIEFVVPAAAHVRRIKLTVGFTSTTEKGDLFLGNHRIAEVEVFRNKTSIGTFALDPNQRGLQELLVDKPGGRYRVQIVSTVAGTNAEWTEVCVSEFQVFGSAPPGVVPKSQTPAVLVGGIIERSISSAVSLELLKWLREINAPSLSSVASLESFCRDWERFLAVEVERKVDFKQADPPYCRLRLESKLRSSGRTSLGRGQSPFMAAQFVTIAYDAWRALLALRTSKGWFLYPMLSGDEFGNPGCSGRRDSALLNLSGTADKLVLRYQETAFGRSPGGDPVRDEVTEYEVICTPDDVDGPLCVQHLLSYRWRGRP